MDTKEDTSNRFSDHERLHPMKKLRITVEGKVYEVTVEILGEEVHETMVPDTGTPKPSAPMKYHQNHHKGRHW